MTADLAAELVLLDLDVERPGVGDEAETWLHDPTRTAHRLVSVPTAALVAQALSDQPAPAAGRVLPGGVWPLLPDRLLVLHPGRRAQRLVRLQIPVTTHLELTATVLEQWGWARARRRTVAGGRCIVGAQYALYRLGWGTEHTAVEAGRRIQGALAQRGITEPYPDWNDRQADVRQVIGVVREAAGGAR
jgi:hypothetical protein